MSICSKLRKKIFQNHGGTYESYLKNSNQVLPLVTVIVNNYDAFQEVYSNYEEIIVQLTREGLKYGINFILSTTATSIRYKLAQNFSQRLVLRMNDNSWDE